MYKHNLQRNIYTLFEVDLLIHSKQRQQDFASYEKMWLIKPFAVQLRAEVLPWTNIWGLNFRTTPGIQEVIGSMNLTKDVAIITKLSQLILINLKFQPNIMINAN